MNTLVFTNFPGVQHGALMGPAPFQALSYGNPTPPPSSGTVVQMVTLQAIGAASNP